jgi:hypothetical protein
VKKFIVVVGLTLGTLSLATVPEEYQAASKAALLDARKLSSEGKYKAAAALLTDVVTTFREKSPPIANHTLRGLENVAAAYEARAEQERLATKDTKAARALLSDLLDPANHNALEAAVPSDPRVAALLVTLRKIDPKAKKFFSARPVRVVVTGDALSQAEADALVEGMVGPLRSLGFAASAKEGTETFTLAVTLGEVIKDIGKDSFLSEALAHSESCQLKIDASWTVGESTLIRLDLSKRGIGFTDIPGDCVRSRIKEIPELLAPRLVKRWDSDYAP